MSSGGTSSSSILNMPDYGQGLANALQAQTDALSGSLTGTPLQQIVEQYERPLRMSAAQIDNDVLRQTLLGGQVPIYKSVSSEDLAARRVSQPGEGGQVTQIDYGGAVTKDGRVVIGDSEIPAGWKKLKEDVAKAGGNLEKITIALHNNKEVLREVDPYEARGWTNFSSKMGFTPSDPDSAFKQIVMKVAFGSADIVDTLFENYGKPEPVYKKNADGTDFIVPKDENGNFILEATNETEIPDGGTVSTTGELTGYTRAGTGLVDMLGDSRMAIDPTTGLPTNRQAGFDAEGNFLGLSALAEDIQRGNLSRQREADLTDVERLSDRYSTLMENYKPGTTSGIDDARTLLEQQRENLTGLREATQADVDAGLASAVGEMIQTGSGGPVTLPSDATFGGSVSGNTMTAATVADPLALSAPTSYDPSASVSGGNFDAGTSYNATAVADPMALTAPTSYDPSASVTGDGYTATANLQGGNIGADSLRAALLADAETALGQGLTEREQASISNATRARSGLMGRTFDQSGAIAEAQALVAENNNRRMQNRAFAGDTLGRESDIQRSDLDRGFQASMRNQDALNRAAEFGASQNMQAQLANQAATNQALSQGLSAGLSQEALAAQQAQAKAMADATATNRASEFGVGAGLEQEARRNQAGLQAQLANQQATNQASQFGVGAGMEQDALRAQLGQQTNLAQAELNQQANAFDADAAQRAATVNQAQRQQAAQFNVGAQMDAERLNEQLRQQGLGNYINAVGNLAQIEDKFTLDPFQAILGRASGGSLQAGQGIFGQAGYGLQSGPQYMNPEAGLGYISSMAANQANMYAANQAANASRSAGMMGGLGSLGGGIIGGLIGLAG
jgi:hypothetical protein